MARGEKQEQGRGKGRKPRPQLRPKQKPATPMGREDLGPERRAELGQEIAAKERRGRPPSI
jgi:hypothetical protein